MWLLAFLLVLLLMSLYLSMMAHSLYCELLRGSKRGAAREAPEGGTDFSCRTTDGCALPAVFYEASHDMRKAMVLIHDGGYAGGSLAAMVPWLLSKGYHVIWYEQRERPTLGYREKKDLRLLITMIRRILGEDCRIGTYGIGVGAATALLHACIDDRINYVIADSAWSDPERLLRQRLWSRGYPAFPVLMAFDGLCRISGGYCLEDVSPIEAIRKRNGLIAIPVLFIAREKLIPKAMSQELYEAKQGSKTLYICDEEDPIQYEAQMDEFLRETCIKGSE